MNTLAITLAMSIALPLLTLWIVQQGHDET